MEQLEIRLFQLQLDWIDLNWVEIEAELGNMMLIVVMNYIDLFRKNEQSPNIIVIIFPTLLCQNICFSTLNQNEDEIGYGTKGD